MTSDLPVALRLAWWGTSWLRGQVVTDLMIDAVIGDDATHLVRGTDPEDHDAVVGLVVGLGQLRRTGASALGATFPVEGDLVGLGGPAEFNLAVVEAREAVVASGAGLGLVPQRVGAAVTWQAVGADRRQLPDVGEADRGLRHALLVAADTLARLEVARWRPEVADRLMNLRRRTPLAAPDGVPPRCVELAGRGLQALEICELALEDDGGALTALEAETRRTALARSPAPGGAPWSPPAPPRCGHQPDEARSAVEPVRLRSRCRARCRPGPRTDSADRRGSRGSAR